MNTLILNNPKPQDGWIAFADFLCVKHGWVKEKQKLVIKLKSKYKLAWLVKLQNDIVELVQKCNELTGIEIYYDDILIHETIKTIPQQIIEARITDQPETPSDERHIKIYESGEKYNLKIN